MDFHLFKTFLAFGMGLFTLISFQNCSDMNSSPSTSALAATESPGVVTSSESSKVLLQTQETVGFPPRCDEAAFSNPDQFCSKFIVGVTVHSDGRVEVRRGLDPARQTISIAAVLESRVISKITELIERLDASAATVNVTPNSPVCADAPSSRFTALQGETQIQVRLDEDCRRFVLQSPGVEELGSFLEGIKSVAELSQ